VVPSETVTDCREGFNLISSLQKFGDKSWTQDKLERVRKYLVAFSKIMRYRSFIYKYIDVFAGTGYHELKAEGNDGVGLFPEEDMSAVATFLEGSARIALQVEPRFNKYIFIEKNHKKTLELEKLREEFPEKATDIIIVEADANDYLQKLCLGRSWKNRRAVLFLDPFGMQLARETIAAIAKTKAIDTWVLFPVGAVNRLLIRDANIPPSWRQRLDTMFGESAWFDTFFPEEKSSLFGGDLIVRRKIADMDLIGKYFNQRLASVFARVAQNPYTLRNTQGAPLFLLCFAAANPNAADTAIKIAEHILGREPAKPAMLPFAD
jgi:three-Cys-motif partner protein